MHENTQNCTIAHATYGQMDAVSDVCGKGVVDEAIRRVKTSGGDLPQILGGTGVGPPLSLRQSSFFPSL